jgi:hypothetical protein
VQLLLQSVPLESVFSRFSRVVTNASIAVILASVICELFAETVTFVLLMAFKGVSNLFKCSFAIFPPFAGTVV